MPHVRVEPAERRKRIAGRLYEDDARARPDWIEEKLLRPGQVAALFQVSRRTVSDWARAGKLDAIITPGGHRRFRAGQVRRLLERSQSSGTSQNKSPKTLVTEGA